MMSRWNPGLIACTEIPGAFPVLRLLLDELLDYAAELRQIKVAGIGYSDSVPSRQVARSQGTGAIIALETTRDIRISPSRIPDSHKSIDVVKQR